MSDYNEHLISMAGGDGDELADIEARVRACKTYNFGMWNADKLAHDDAPYLLALVNEQRARLAVVAELANWSAKHGWKLDAAAIRAALEPKP